MRQLFLFCLFSLNFFTVIAQGAYIPLGSYSIHQLDRMEIKQGRLANPNEFNTSTKAYLRGSIGAYADSFELKNNIQLSKQDQFNLQYLQNDNFEYSTSSSTKTKRGLFGSGLFKHKAAFYDVEIPDFKLIVNPVVYLKAEHDQALNSFSYINTRGLELRGQLGKKLSFYTLIADENQKLNSWNQSYYNTDSVVPGQPYYHTTDYRSFNYFLASGYLSYQPYKFMDIQFGHSRNFLGNGYRSFMMSDFSTDNLFLRINTRIWKINYTNIWGEVLDYVYGGYQHPKRHYYATTYANVNITKKLSIGLFQTISFQRDSGYADGGYDPQYLNPIIFYKAVENGLNSPDKAILGADAKYNFAKHFSVYGQFVLSEFSFKHVFEQTDSLKGWFANKYAIQLGVKYIDVFNIQNLDLQYEFNWARPYMYTSYTSLNAYSNYNQNMAHPTGANFKENIIILRYQPINRLFITGKTIISMYGNDTNGSNWGKNIRLNYYTYEKEYGNKVGQGATTYLYVAELNFSYMFWHNVFVDISCVYRKTKSVVNQFDTQTFNPSIGLRWNMNYRGCDF